jgi:hypothetical protein
MDRSDFQELLANLYLRLNGYFTSGFIVHAPASNLTEVDILAVRFPNNAEPEREVIVSRYLQIPEKQIDILICEVKGAKTQLQFNSALRSNQEAIEKVLRWAGMFAEEHLPYIAEEVKVALTPKEINTPDRFIEIPITNYDDYLVRGILFALDRNEPNYNQPRFIHGQEILNFVHSCLFSKDRRPASDTRYDFGLWSIYEDIVRYFKNRTSPGSMENVYQQFSIPE